MQNKTHSLSFGAYNFMYALWTVLGVYNFYFWKQVWPTVSIPVILLLMVVVLLIEIAIQSILFHPKTVKPLSILFLILNALAGYFINTYHFVLNKTTLANIFETNFFEATEWMGGAFWMYLLAFAVLPSILVWRVQIRFESWQRRFLKTGIDVLMVALLLSVFIPYKADVKMYLKTNFNLRYQFVPTGYVSALVSLMKSSFKNGEVINSTSGMVQNPYWQKDKKNLIVFVLGESARDASFSLSDYQRDTAEPLRPYLKDMTVFHQTESCGVVTRVSVPCLFSVYNRDNYSERAAVYSTNILDILQKNNMNMLWLDNELGCNKVCRNIPTEYTCQSRDCLDMLLNDALRKRLPTFDKDTFVVLHQRGSHGPRYDLRLPKDLRKWTPFCERSDSQNCSSKEITNAYDSTIYYTSFLVADLIQALSGLTAEYNPILIYVSDHGESLGENGVYGHGGDFKDAPIEQKQVPFFVWMPKSTREAFGFDKKCLDQKTKAQQSHDVIFHSLMGLMGIRTDVYNEKLDIFAGCHR